MDYETILKEIRPDDQEKNRVESLAKSMIDFINYTAKKENISTQAMLVGSIAKNTWLSGRADIDIFLHFPLETSLSDLKKNGLNLGYKCIKKMNGKPEERYASHPYVTGHIEGYTVDFVPCYSIDNSQQLKSAVDRTILHTHYIQKNLKEKQINHVLLLKKFMEGVETYGSEFKVGGFAGYLCELLIIEYGGFKAVLEAASSQWKKGSIIDLENYGTGKDFKEPLVVIDPVDKKRNVAAALNIQKMAEFIAASRNFLQKPKKEYFSRIPQVTNKEKIQTQFDKRGTNALLITFKTPKVPADAIYPQLKKTETSLKTKMEENGFKVLKSDYWTDESEIALILLEFSVWDLPKYAKHLGPRVWDGDHQKKFLEKYGNAWLDGDQWVVEIERKHGTAKSLLEFLLTRDNIHHLKIGKHLKEEILRQYELIELREFLGKKECSPEALDFFYRFLNPCLHLFR
jgi:tRNA nucleotidyltransferase (CCA-adding enzyme)